MTGPAGTFHVCHVTGAFIGGTFHSVRQLANGQARRGLGVSVVHNVLGQLPANYGDDFHPAVRLIPWPVRREVAPIGDGLAQLRLLRTLLRLEPSVLHLHSSKAGLLGRLAGWLLDLPHVYSPRGISFNRRDVSAAKLKLFRGLERLGSKMGGLTVACSRDEKAAVAGLDGRSHLIPNGLDLAEIDPLLGPSRRTGEDTRFHVVVCGRITAARNPALVARLADASPPHWRWSWIGDGELRPSIENHRRVDLLGWKTRAEMFATLRRADVLLHASAWEGMPLAVLEAMAAALPVVASDVVGNRDLVRSGDTGWLVTQEDDYLPALTRLADDPALRTRMGRAGRSVVESSHDAERLCDEWIDVYRAECDCKKGAVLTAPLRKME